MDVEEKDLTDFYNEVPVEPRAVQDAIFQILLTLQTRFGLDMMQSHIVIAPRHLNELLAVEKKRPDWMLLTLRQFLLKQVISGNLHYSAERVEL